MVRTLGIKIVACNLYLPFDGGILFETCYCYRNGKIMLMLISAIW